MPIVNKIDGLTVKRRCSSNLFIKNNKSKKIVKDDGEHLTNNYRINSVTKMALSIADKLTPVIKKYPKFGKIIVFSCEKFIKVSEKF